MRHADACLDCSLTLTEYNFIKGFNERGPVDPARTSEKKGRGRVASPLLLTLTKFLKLTVGELAQSKLHTLL